MTVPPRQISVKSVCIDSEAPHSCGSDAKKFPVPTGLCELTASGLTPSALPSDQWPALPSCQGVQRVTFSVAGEVNSGWFAAVSSLTGFTNELPPPPKSFQTGVS
jgi:hypothetical protein